MAALAVTSSKTGNSIDGDLLFSEKQETFEASHIEILLSPPSSAPFAVTGKEKKLAPPARVVRTRLEASFLRPEVADYVQLHLRTNDPIALIKQLGSDKLIASLSDRKLAKTISDSFAKVLTTRTNDMRLNLNADDLKWIDTEKLARLLAVRTTNAHIGADSWIEALTLHRPGLQEHFGKRFPEVLGRVTAWINENPGEDIPLEQLLPAHLQETLGTFHPYRGRNCFATALSFADKGVVGRGTINSVREEEHDRFMINSDEFSQALWLGYTELKPEDIMSGLRYGDVVVFLEGTEPANQFRTLRHAAVHVADQIYYHKSSKSAATPIEFVTWGKLVANWSSLTKKLDYRVFRKTLLGTSHYLKPSAAIDKMQWFDQQ